VIVATGVDAPTSRSLGFWTIRGEAGQRIQILKLGVYFLQPSVSAPQDQPDPQAGQNQSGLGASNLGATQGMGPGEAAGTVVGRYHLLQKIGEGGMGEVWLAEQKEPVRRRVALKLIKAGMSSREVIARFESERQALALMDHPAIAKVLDAGSTPQGTPYFVMEYVAGVPITTYCDNHRLSTPERLALFMRVCEGVQHAHQKAIIHRDLKPSNILVTEIDGKAAPKIIDFGVAKALTQKLTADTMFTRVGSLIGTPEYMSPEQALSSGEDIDTRTDVYSLGIVFYELLAGMPPIELHKIAFDEFLRRLREDDPPKPSTKFRTQDPATSTELARKRHTEPPALAKQLQGDLDAITLKALEKERSRRYATPTELAADIERYLRNEPVLARSGNAVYRARKYLRRHRLAIAVAATVLVLLGSFAVVEAVQLRRIKRESEQRARVTEFMTNMFKVSNPSEARGSTITAREILDKASKEIDRGLAKDPEAQAQMMSVMGNVYEGLGLYPRAHPLLERAAEIRSQVLGPKNLETLRSKNDLAIILRDEDRSQESEKLARETLEMERRLLGPEHPDTLRSMTTLAGAVSNQGRVAEAEKLGRETLEIQRRVLGPDHPDTLTSMNGLAVDLYKEGRLAEAEKLYRETLQIRRRVLGPDHPDTLLSMANLGGILIGLKRYPEAAKVYGEALEIERRVLGPEHPSTVNSMGMLAHVLISDGRYAEAEKLERQALEIQRRVLGPEDPLALYMMHDLANAVFREGHYAEGEKLLRETIEIQRRVLGPDSPRVALLLYDLGCMAALQGHSDEAFSLLDEAVKILPESVSRLIEGDADLTSLHGDPRYAALVARAKERAAAAQKAH